MTTAEDVKQPAGPVEVFRKDYAPVPYDVPKVDLDVVLLSASEARVTTRLTLLPREAAGGARVDGGTPVDASLDKAPAMKIVSVRVDGVALTEGGDKGYTVTPKKLTVPAAALAACAPGAPVVLETVVVINPEANTSLEGLYKSASSFCTQCEAEGFRGIAPMWDRPDVMSTYRVRVEGARATEPVLLSNGNLVDSGDVEGSPGRHFAVWEDPHRKPCYLFALVAGDLGLVEDTFTTKSGRTVVIKVLAQAHNIDRCGHCVESLKHAMRWDEERFGLEYDLDVFHVVAVDDFNMGAMENKSLNVFNSRLVLASPETATDLDYYRIEGVVGHEYFHNWTGNRVTCRDWFQLTLKEGLTVFRDPSFTSDRQDRAVKRIEDVAGVRSRQFAEDGGPLAHPIRPDSYRKMDNFYTSTVYEKGAEIITMYQTWLGVDGFRRGMDEYFKRHDGTAVTCDDFRAAMAEAPGNEGLLPAEALAAWYEQAGTPRVTASCSHNAADGTFTLELSQWCPATPGQPNKRPFPVPVRVGLLGPDGVDLPLQLTDKPGEDLGTSTVVTLLEERQSFTFTGIGNARPVPSLLRGWSAPVILTVEGQTDEDLLFLLRHDSDPFNRWEAGQRLARGALLKLYDAAIAGEGGWERHDAATGEAALSAADAVSDALIEGYRATLVDTNLTPAFKADALGIPSAVELIEGGITDADPVALHAARSYLARQLAERLRPELEAQLAACDAAVDPVAPYRFIPADVGVRTLRGALVRLLQRLPEPPTNALVERFTAATNMTDQMACLGALAMTAGPARDAALSSFYDQWKAEPLVVLKWLSVVASSDVAGNTAVVRKLMAGEPPAFSETNPNSCYSLIGGFAASAVNFHSADGSGYEFLADAVLRIDSINGQVASRLVGPLCRFKKYDVGRQGLMRAQLERIAAKKGLTDNVAELVNKSLA